MAGDYATVLNSVGEDKGNSQTTSQGDAASCSLANWMLNGTDMTVVVLRYGSDGTTIDSGFSLAYNYVA